MIMAADKKSANGTHTSEDKCQRTSLVGRLIFRTIALGPKTSISDLQKNT